MSGTSRDEGRRLPLLALLGVALLAAYALPVYAPPPGVVPASPSADASLFARLFPGVPVGWVAWRLVALALGAVALAAALPSAPRIALPAPPSPAQPPSARAIALSGLSLLALLFAAPVVGQLSRAGELAWLLAQGIPAAILVVLGGRRPLPERASARRGLLVGGAIAAAFVALRLAVVHESPRTADPIDLWEAYHLLLQAVRDGTNVLASAVQPGVHNHFMLGLGITFMEPGGFTPTLFQATVLHGLWLVATAALVGSLASRSLGADAAPLAVVAWLASPFLLLMFHSPAPFGMFFCVNVGTLALLWRFAATGSLAVLTGLASLAGIAASSAYLLPWIGITGLCCALLLLRDRPRPGWAFWLLPVLAFGAAAGPVLPGPSAFGELVAEAAARHADFALLDNILAGQVSPFGTVTGDELWRNGRPGPFDVALGSLLSPFAAPRTSVRMWADVAFEPITACLAAVGLAVCLRQARSSAGARAALLLLLVSLLPAALASAYDRASLTRNLALPMSLALLAAYGTESARRALFPGASRRAAYAAVAAVMLVSGLVLFDGVTPRVLPASARALHAEALGGVSPSGGAVLLGHAGPHPVPWLGIEWAGAHLLPRPVPARPWKGPESFSDSQGRLPAVFLWSPALEQDAPVGRSMCQLWPEAVLFRLVDRAGLSTAWAGWLPRAGPAWEPALPSERVSRMPCSGP